MRVTTRFQKQMAERQNIAGKGYFLAQRANKASAEDESSLQVLEGNRHSGPYLLVQYNWKYQTTSVCQQSR